MTPARKLYTLTEVSKATGISMPTLQRYKNLHQDRIPSEGEGRKQRYPRAALAVFKKLREENLKKRGRPAKKKRAAAKTASKRRGKARSKAKTKARTKTRAKRGSGQEKLLTLLEIGRRTGISYPTLLRYVKVYGDEIPHVGEGRRRRFPVAAVKEFRRLRRSSKRGPRAGQKRAPAASARRAAGTDQALKARVRELEKAQRQVTRQLDEIVRLLKKPMQITVRSD